MLDNIVEKLVGLAQDKNLEGLKLNSAIKIAIKDITHDREAMISVFNSAVTQLNPNPHLLDIAYPSVENFVSSYRSDTSTLSLLDYSTLLLNSGSYLLPYEWGSAIVVVTVCDKTKLQALGMGSFTDAFIERIKKYRQGI